MLHADSILSVIAVSALASLAGIMVSEHCRSKRRVGRNLVGRFEELESRVPNKSFGVSPSAPSDVLASLPEAIDLGPFAKLPPFGPVVISLLRLFDREDVAPGEITNLIQADPALCSELLAHVNSPLYGFQSNVLNPSHAVVMLGADRVKAMAAALALRFMMREAPVAGIVRRFWNHSIATAALAERLSGVFGLDAGLAHTSGVLHDLGRFGLLAAFGARYARFAVQSFDSEEAILAAEKEEFGMNHCESGLLIARAWSIPTSFLPAIGNHHKPDPEAGLAELTRLCCRLSDTFHLDSIHRWEIQSPQDTVDRHVPSHLRASVSEQVRNIEPALIGVIQKFDF